jgi:hypothetical protein
VDKSFIAVVVSGAIVVLEQKPETPHGAGPWGGGPDLLHFTRMPIHLQPAFREEKVASDAFPIYSIERQTRFV